MNLTTAPIDDNTKLALQVGVALLGVVGVSIGAARLVQGCMCLPTLVEKTRAGCMHMHETSEAGCSHVVETGAAVANPASAHKDIPSGGKAK